MPARKYYVELNAEERLTLERAARSNKRSLLERQRARILLASARGQSDAAVARAVGVCLNTVANVRRRFVAAARRQEGAGAKTVRRAVQTRRKARSSTAKRRRPWWPWSARGRPRGARPGRWSCSQAA